MRELKLLPEFFDAAWRGDKPFEIRKNDRGFEVGQEWRLLEWSPKKGYTGYYIDVEITFITDWEQLEGNVVWGYEELSKGMVNEAALNA